MVHKSIKSNREMISGLDSRIYWQPTLEALNAKLDKIQSTHDYTEKKALIKVLDFLEEIMRDSQQGVEEMIQERIKKGEIHNADNARKPAAGSNFQALAAYSLAMNVIKGNLPPLYVVIKPKKHPIVEEYVTISVGSEEQKPDMDLLIYSDSPQKPIVIYSCKTSLRERAGQTYRWKLLLEFVTSSCPYIVNKEGQPNPECPINRFKIERTPKRPIKVGFITPNFYEEINNPQQRGMYGFFDFVYLASDRPVQSPVTNLSRIISDLKSLYA